MSLVGPTGTLQQVDTNKVDVQAAGEVESERRSMLAVSVGQRAPHMLEGVTKDAVALRRLVPVIVTVDAAPPETPAVPVTLAICGPTSTPRPNGKVTVPLLSVKVTE